METRPGVPQNGGNGLVFDQPRSKRDHVHREGSGVPQNGGNGPPTVETGVLFIGRGVAYRKTGHRSSPPSASSSLHGILFIHRRPPPASTCDCSSTGSYSSSLHCALLHRLLFNHPSTGTPPPSTVHPALHTTGSCSSRGNATAHCSSNPPAMLTVHPIDRLQLAAVAKESLDRVQLTAIDRSLGFSNA